MPNRIAMMAAAGLLAAACASNPAAGPSGAAPSSPSAAPAPSVPSGTATLMNMAGSTVWIAEEKLIPDDPVMALVNSGVNDTDLSVGVAAVCKAANGDISLRLGKQPGTRLGQTATFKIRSGPSARDVSGRFEASRTPGETDFVFPITSADLLAIGQPDIVSFVSDTGDVQWALVKTADAQVQARYVGSLRNFANAARDFITYCNPK